MTQSATDNTSDHGTLWLFANSHLTNTITYLLTY